GAAPHPPRSLALSPPSACNFPIQARATSHSPTSPTPAGFRETMAKKSPSEIFPRLLYLHHSSPRTDNAVSSCPGLRRDPEYRRCAEIETTVAARVRRSVGALSADKCDDECVSKSTEVAMDLLEARKARARTWFETLRDDLCAGFEALEDALPAGAAFSARAAGPFARTPRGRPRPGGGARGGRAGSRVEGGAVGRGGVHR